MFQNIWHRFLGIALLGEAIWYVYALGFHGAFRDIQTAFLLVVTSVVGVILVAKG